MQGTLRVKNATLLVTMDDEHCRIADGGLFVRDNVIEAVGPTATLPATADRSIDARGMVLLPGLVNTHHHLYQTLTRAVPGGQDALLFGWLKTLYPIWSRFGPDEMFTSAQVGLAELALSGCTMTSDHLYLYPNGSRLDDTIAAAGDVGLRWARIRAQRLGRAGAGARGVVPRRVRRVGGARARRGRRPRRNDVPQRPRRRAG